MITRQIPATMVHVLLYLYDQINDPNAKAAFILCMEKCQEF